MFTVLHVTKGGLITSIIFCLQVDGPISGGAYKRQFTLVAVVLLAVGFL